MTKNPTRPPARTTAWLRVLRALCASTALGCLASVSFLDALSRMSDSEFVYVTAASRLSSVALVPLVGAIAGSLVLALIGRVGQRGEPVEVRSLIILDIALIAAVASIATRDNAMFLPHDPARWPALFLGLIAAAAAALGATSLMLSGTRRSSASSPLSIAADE